MSSVEWGAKETVKASCARNDRLKGAMASFGPPGEMPAKPFKRLFVYL